MIWAVDGTAGSGRLIRSLEEVNPISENDEEFLVIMCLTLLFVSSQAHGHWVRSLRLTPNGRVLLSGSGDSTIGMYVHIRLISRTVCKSYFSMYLRWEVNAEGTNARLIKLLRGHTDRECPQTFWMLLNLGLSESPQYPTRQVSDVSGRHRMGSFFFQGHVTRP